MPISCLQDEEYDWNTSVYMWHGFVTKNPDLHPSGTNDPGRCLHSEHTFGD